LPGRESVSHTTGCRSRSDPGMVELQQLAEKEKGDSE
jgi:hypothetical protein